MLKIIKFLPQMSNEFMWTYVCINSKGFSKVIFTFCRWQCRLGTRIFAFFWNLRAVKIHEKRENLEI